MCIPLFDESFIGNPVESGGHKENMKNYMCVNNPIRKIYTKSVFLHCKRLLQYKMHSIKSPHIQTLKKHAIRIENYICIYIYIYCPTDENYYE